VREVVRVERRGEADRDDQQEEDGGGERDPVPAQAPRGEAPRAPAGDLPKRLAAGRLL
jgi:hypothetical protein